MRMSDTAIFKLGFHENRVFSLAYVSRGWFTFEISLKKDKMFIDIGYVDVIINTANSLGSNDF